MEDEIKTQEPNESKEVISSDSLPARDQRSLIFHLLYAAESFDYDTSLDALVDNFARGYNIAIPRNSALFYQVSQVIAERAQLDELYMPLLDNWRYDRLGTATKLILRNALWELNNTQTDPIIIINEAVELAKCFAEKDAYKFINGILDQYLKKNNLKS